MEKGVALVIAVLVCFASISSAQEIAGALMAKALYYEEPDTSYCFGELELGTLVAYVSNDLWEKGKACGRIYGVWCQRASSDDLEPACLGPPQSNNGVYVKIADKCKGCDNGTILLSEEAFEYIARKEAGSIQVAYKSFSQ